MSLFSKRNRKGGFMDEIRCDEPSYLIWKWHPAGVQSGEGNRENSIRWGSSLRVKDGEVAVFVYKQKNGTAQDFIVGPFDQIIKTANLPVLADILALDYEGGTPFQAEIYFINLAQIIQTRFAVPYFDVYDPRFSDFSVPVAARGTISFRIADYREFIKLHRLNTFNLDDFQKELRDVVSRYVKDALANAPAVHSIPVIQIESKIAQINDDIEYIIAERLRESFGVRVSGVDIGAIEIDKASEGYCQLISVTKDLAAATAKAEADAQIKNISDKQRIEIENYEGLLRIQREEGQYAQHKQTQSANFAAFQIETQAEVGIAGANALGQMGANEAGSVNLGGGDGFNMAAMMASMAVGGAVGQNLAGAMNNIMGNICPQTTPATVSSQLPSVAYHVAVNGKATDALDIAALLQMASVGQLTPDSMVWKTGMTQWEKAGAVDELKCMFTNMPPIPSMNE